MSSGQRTHHTLYLTLIENFHGHNLNVVSELMLAPEPITNEVCYIKVGH